MRTIILLALVGLISAALHQHPLVWRESKKFKMIRNGEYGAYLEYLKNLRIASPNEFASLPQNGVFAQDTVRFGDVGESQLSVPTTVFGVASQISSDFADDSAEGILGLAFTSLAVDGVVPPLINAINQGILDQPLFTVWLEHRGALNNVGGGVFTYGAIDTTNWWSMITYHPLSSASYYQFKVSGSALGTYRNTNVVDAISNTGTSFLGGPKTVVAGLAAAANATCDENYDMYFIDCNAIPYTLDITIGTYLYPIQPVNFIVTVLDNLCAFAVFSFDFGGFGSSWILGDPFIRQYCNIYDIGNKQIGFAASLQG